MLVILVYAVAITVAQYLLAPAVEVLKNALEDATGAGIDDNIAKYTTLLIYMAAMYLLAVLTNYGLNRLMLQATANVMRDLRNDLFDKMQELPISYFDSHTHGELMSYYTNDVDAIREMLNHSVTQMLISSMALVGIIVSMLRLSAPLFCVVLILGALVVLITKVIASKSGKSYAWQQKAVASVNGYIEEMMEGQRVVKAFNHEAKGLEAFDVMNEELRRASTRANTLASIMGPIMNNLSHIFYALVTTIGVLFAANGELIAKLSAGSFDADGTVRSVKGVAVGVIKELEIFDTEGNRIGYISTDGTVRDGESNVLGYISINDGKVTDAEKQTIGFARGVRVDWIACYYFFHFFEK